MIIAMQLDEVIAHGEDMVKAVPIPEGKLLYHCLCDDNQIALVASEPEERLVKHWLQVEGLLKHSYLVWGKSTFRAQYEELLRQGVVPDLYITADPNNLLQAQRTGVPTFLYAHPQFMRPGFRPDDRGAKSWADIEEEVTSQKVKKAEKDRALLTEAMTRHTD